jgi:hypothetical protein
MGGDVPDTGWIGGLAKWLTDFGTGARGFVALAMVLLTIAFIFCVPSMWKAWLIFRIDRLKFETEHKHLDLEIAKRFERIVEAQERKGKP